MITSNFSDFSIKFDKLIKKSELNTANVVKAVSFTLLSKVMLKSPVDTGMLRGNWNTGINAIDLGEYGKDRSGQSSLARGLGKISNFKLGDNIWITNNMTYAHKLEYGLYGDGSKTVNGYSTQAPHGFVRITFKEVTSGLRQIAEKVIK